MVLEIIFSSLRKGSKDFSLALQLFQVISNSCYSAKCETLLCFTVPKCSVASCSNVTGEIVFYANKV